MRAEALMARAVLIAAAFAFSVTAANCAESPANPSSLSSPSPTSSPLPPGTSATLTGTVFETTPDGPRPVPGAYLNAIGGGGDSISAYADADGRYAFTNKQVGATVIVQAVSVPGVRVARHQPCVASVVMQKDSSVDVEFNLAGVRGTGGPPLVSGTVFQTTPGGRQPVPERQVMYYVVTPSGASFLATSTFTDDEGRYEFCKVPLGPGRVWVTDPSNWDGFPAATKDVSVSVGDVVVEIDIP
jgi:hypothetical protein